MREIIKKLNGVSSRLELKSKMLWKKHVKHGGVYAVVFALLIVNCCPMVKVHAETVVEVTSDKEIKKAISEATDTTADSPLTLKLKGDIVFNENITIQNKHIKITSDGTGEMKPEVTESIKVKGNSSLTFEKITYDDAHIYLSDDSRLTLNEGSNLSGVGHDVVSEGTGRNTITMNSGSKINVSYKGKAITGDTYSLTMNAGSLIEGDGSADLVVVEGDNTIVTLNGNSLIGGLKGINIDGTNNAVNLNSGLISNCKEAGVYMNSEVNNAITMGTGMEITNNKQSGVYLNNATFIMNGGIISNNSTSYSYGGGGIIAHGNTTVQINDGIIEKNTCNSLGAGISADGYGDVGVIVKVEMNGGTIRNNIAKDEEAGIGGMFVGKDAAFTLNGGSIVSNEGGLVGGVYAINGVLLKGNAIVKDNTLSDKTTQSNALLANDSNSSNGHLQITGAVTGEIGVSTRFNKIGALIASGSDYQITDADANAIKSDTGLGNTLKENTLLFAEAAKDVSLKKDLDNQLQLVKKNKEVTLEVEAISDDKDNLKYQWFVNDKASTKDAIKLENETKEKLVLKNDKKGNFYYYVVVTNNKNHTEKTVTSKIVPITVYEEAKDKGTISGKITCEDTSASVEGIIIKIYQGNTLLEETTTDKNGEYAIPNLPNGSYNLVIEKDLQKITTLIEVNDSLINSSTTLPRGVQNTTVEIVGEKTPTIVVDGLNDLYKNTTDDGTKGITKAEIEKAENLECLLELKFHAENKEVKDIQEEANKLQNLASKDNQEIGMYIDLGIMKTLTTPKADALTTRLSEIPKNIEIRIQIPDTMKTKKNLQVYRIRDGITEKLSSNVKDEEYFKIEGNYIVIHAKNLSLYALGYDKVVEPDKPIIPNDPTTPSEPIKPLDPTKPSGNSGVVTGDMTSIAGSSFAMMSSMGVMAVAYRKMKKQYDDNHEEGCFLGLRNKWKFTKFLLHKIKDKLFK